MKNISKNNYLKKTIATIIQKDHNQKCFSKSINLKWSEKK